jgi:hypothetical protein
VRNRDVRDEARKEVIRQRLLPSGDHIPLGGAELQAGDAMGWLFLIGISTLLVTPIYRVVMRPFSGIQKVYVFFGVAVPVSALCRMLLKEDPRGVAGPGYLVIFLFGPFALGWISCGIISLIGWVAVKALRGGASGSGCVDR